MLQLDPGACEDRFIERVGCCVVAFGEGNGVYFELFPDSLPLGKPNLVAIVAPKAAEVSRKAGPGKRERQIRLAWGDRPLLALQGFPDGVHIAERDLLEALPRDSFGARNSSQRPLQLRVYELCR